MLRWLAETETVAVVGFHHVTFPQKEDAVLLSVIFLDVDRLRLGAVALEFAAQGFDIRDGDIERPRRCPIVIGLGDQPDLNVIPFQDCGPLIFRNQNEPERLRVEPNRRGNFPDGHCTRIPVANRRNSFELYHGVPYCRSAVRNMMTKLVHFAVFVSPTRQL